MTAPAKVVRDLDLSFKVAGQPFALRIAFRPGLGLTPREHGTIRRQTGYVGSEQVLDALLAEDQELAAVLAVVAAARSGVELDLDALLDGDLPLELDAAFVDDAPAGSGSGNGDGAAAPTSPTTKPTRARTGTRS